jgi:hypothetical protein
VKKRLLLKAFLKDDHALLMVTFGNLDDVVEIENMIARENRAEACGLVFNQQSTMNGVALAASAHGIDLVYQYNTIHIIK